MGCSWGGGGLDLSMHFTFENKRENDKITHCVDISFGSSFEDMDNFCGK